MKSYCPTTKLFCSKKINIVQEIVKNEKKIHHLNFSQLISQGKINLEKYVFQENDPGSHLKTQYHASIFVQKIIDQLIVD